MLGKILQTMFLVTLLDRKKMKNIFLVLGFTILLIGCNKPQIQEIFDQSPEIRAQERLALLHDTLVGASNGWKGVLTTTLGGAYSFYFKFSPDNTVEMLADIDETTSVVIKSSTFRTKWVMDASLLFDTYNYIALLQDPAVKIPNAGGTAGNGLRSDVEFEYVRMTQDSIIMKGKRYGNPLLLTRLSASDEDLYKDSGLYNSVDKMDDFLERNQIPYLSIDGINIVVELNFDTKKVNASYLQDGITVTESTKWYFDLNGIGFLPQLNILGKQIQQLSFEGDDLYALLVDGSRIKVENSSIPLLPILDFFGYNKSNKRILSDEVPGVTANMDIFKRVRELFESSNRYITNMYFELTNSTNATFFINYDNAAGSSFIASATYSYRIVGDRLFITQTSVDTNWLGRSVQVAPVNNLFGTGDEKEFIVEWVQSNDPNVGYPIAGLRSVINTQDLLYGRLGN